MVCRLFVKEGTTSKFGEAFSGMAFAFGTTRDKKTCCQAYCGWMYCSCCNCCHCCDCCAPPKEHAAVGYASKSTAEGDL